MQNLELLEHCNDDRNMIQRIVPEIELLKRWMVACQLEGTRQTGLRNLFELGTVWRQVGYAV